MKQVPVSKYPYLRRGSVMQGEFEYPQIDMKLTGRLLRRISKQKKLTVYDIQKALGLASNQAVYDWFNGKTLPTLNNFFALSKLFEVPMDWMIVTDEVPIEEQAARISGGDKQLIRMISYKKRWIKVCA